MTSRKKSKNKKGVATGLIAENRRARFDYEIIDTLEAGIVLTGTEVRSLRNGKAQITESYASPEKGELWLINSYIPEYVQANQFNHKERRARKLLVSKRELSRLIGEVQRAGNTIVPLKIYFNDRGLVKLLLGLGKGKRNVDKRETQKKRDWQREKSRLMKSHYQ
ncbi:tmRNA-binding protein SmpB [hydrothermal vent metagenome]|uniref:TmRNA-binding protein SmpB n=1 Tax=hydrothermal vent metagenome TaxID=652676 RepID=A0A3B0TCB8_9ZZZZ